MIQLNKILYPTDFSSFSTQAYFHALAIAEHRNADLTIVYVFHPEGNAHDDAMRSEYRRQLEEIRPVNPNIKVHHIFLEGDPAAQITRFAGEAGIDMIVLGTHGRNPTSNRLMGSVAEQVMRHAPCSVLVVKMARSNVQGDEPDLTGETHT